MSITNINTFYSDLYKNIKDMEDTLKDRPKTVDRDYCGFIQILNNDLNELRSSNFDKTKIGELSSKLELASDRVYELASLTFENVNANDVRPLVGRKKHISTIAKELKEGPEKNGLDKLHPFFKMRSIAGDGHCLFRAIGVGLIDYVNTSSKRDRTIFLSKISNIDLRAFLQKPKKDAYKESDMLVAMLRRLAVDDMEDSTNEVLKEITTPEYLKEMSDMSKCAHGGEPELVAISNIFGLDFRVVDSIVVAKNQKLPQEYLEGKTNKTVFLLHTPIHYDILYPR